MQGTTVRGKIFIISGPSGVGKTTVVDLLMKRLKDSAHIRRVITYTTKSPRPGDIDGVHYHFISSAEFQKKIDEGFFIEYSTAYGASYGSPRSILYDVDQGISSILVLDRAGVEAIAKVTDRVVPILLYADVEGVVKQRLAGRQTESSQEMERRLAQSTRELEQEKAHPLYAYRLLNIDSSQTAEQLLEVFHEELL